MVLATPVPTILTDPGTLVVAPIGSTVPSNTVAGGIFTDSWDAAWLYIGATEDGSELSYNTTVQPVSVAEYFDPIAYRTTDRAGNFAFAVANFGATAYRRALNGGAAAVSPTSGTGATALYTVTPTSPGSEVRVMVGWESLDRTVRVIAYQCFSGGEVKSAFKKAPSKSLIPMQANFEVPSSGIPFSMFFAGSGRA